MIEIKGIKDIPVNAEIKETFFIKTFLCNCGYCGRPEQPKKGAEKINPIALDSKLFFGEMPEDEGWPLCEHSWV